MYKDKQDTEKIYSFDGAKGNNCFGEEPIDSAEMEVRVKAVE